MHISQNPQLKAIAVGVYTVPLVEDQQQKPPGCCAR